MGNDYRIAFKAACADLGAISALLGFEAYPGVDALLRSITELLAAHSAGAQGEPVVIMDAALTEICNWPDGGSRYGQGNIMRFAKEKLDKARRARFNAQPQPMPQTDAARDAISLLRETLHKAPDYEWGCRRNSLLERIAEIERLDRTKGE